MPRPPYDKRLENRAARTRLPARHEPFWRAIRPGVHIGYYRARSGAGTWLLRVRAGKRYRFDRIGAADDFAAPSGDVVLNYGQAVTAALRRAEELIAEGGARRRGPYTVRACVADYLEHYARDGRSGPNTLGTFEAHILPAFGDRLVTELTTGELRAFLSRLVDEGPLVRSSRGDRRHRAEIAAADTDEAAERLRRRRARANRVWTYFRAALNFAFREGRVHSDVTWRRVKPFRGVEQPRIRFLSAAEGKRLLNGCDDRDFRNLVHGALMTGGRYGELAGLTVSDYQAASATVHFRKTKSRKDRHVPLTAEGERLFTRLTVGRLGNELIFTRGGREWRQAEQTRPMRAAVRSAKIEPAISFHGLRHTYGANLAMAKTPLQVIAAALGHADTRLTEKWYAHLLPSYVADTVRANLPVFLDG